MEKRKIIELLADILIGEINAEELKEFLLDECKYDSDYGKKHFNSSERIIKSLNSVNENVKNDETDCSYNCTVIELSSVLKDGITFDDLNDGDISDVYEYGILMYQYHSDKPAAVVYLKFCPSGKVSEIELSRNKNWFDLEFYGDLEDSEKDIPYTVKPMSRSDRQVKEMREVFRGQKIEYEELDDREVYIWRRADRFIQGWLEDEGYIIVESEVFDDSIGYRCVRDRCWYTVYMYASGKNQRITVNGEYCAKLEEREFSKGFVLVACLKVERDQYGDKFEYEIGFLNNPNNKNIALWHPHNIMGKNVLVYFPRKEIYDSFDRFMYAFNNESLDAYDCIIAPYNLEFKEFDEGRYVNRGFYTYLHHIFSKYGKMKCGYLSLDGLVYNQISYIDGYGWFSFSVDNNGLICSVISHPFNEKVIDFLKAEEDVPERIFSDIPKPESIRILPPVLTERFAVIVKYDNSEKRKYVLPIEEKYEDEEDIRHEGHYLSDEIWESAKLVESHKARYDVYPDGGYAIVLKNGFYIPIMKCYELGVPFSEPEKCDDILYEDENIELKAIWKWDADSVWSTKEGILDVVVSGKALWTDTKSTLATVSGERLTSLDFDRLSYADEGLFRVGMAGRGYGFVNAKGEFVIPPIYDYAEFFENGYSNARKGEKWTLLTPQGKEINLNSKSGKDYEEVGRISEGMCAVSTMKLRLDDLAYYSDDSECAGIWGYVDETGKEVIEPQYIYAYPFDNGVALVCKGKWTRDPKWNNRYKKGRYWTEYELWGGINKEGETVIPFIFDEISQFGKDKNNKPVYKVHYNGWDDGHWGVIDYQGNWLADPVFEDIGYEFYNGMFAFYNGDKWDDAQAGVYDINQKKVIVEPQYDDIDFRDDGNLDVEIQDEEHRSIFKIVDLQCNDIVDSGYTKINTHVPDSRTAAYKRINGERKVGIVDAAGNEIVPFEYADISYSKKLLDQEKFVFRKDGKWGVSRFDGSIVIEPVYDRIIPCDNGLFIISSEQDKDSSFMGLISETGEEILEEKYEKIFEKINDLFILNDGSTCIAVKYRSKR